MSEGLMRTTIGNNRSANTTTKEEQQKSGRGMRSERRCIHQRAINFRGEVEKVSRLSLRLWSNKEGRKEGNVSGEFVYI